MENKEKRNVDYLWTREKHDGVLYIWFLSLTSKVENQWLPWMENTLPKIKEYETKICPC